MHFYHSNLRTRIENLVKSCDACQRFKLPGKGYGELPPREAQLAPWQEIAVDLIGPWSINVNEVKVMLNALSILDTVTNFAELIRISNKSAAHVGLQLERLVIALFEAAVRDPRSRTGVQWRGFSSGITSASYF